MRAQTFKDVEVKVIVGVRPAARARNIGVAETSADFIVFVDDDARLGHDRVLERLVEVAESGPDVGIVGPSKILSPRASSLQRRIAREVPRWQFPVVERDVEANPPTDRHGSTGITTTCCLVPRRVFEEMDGFDEQLTTGEDPEFFFRVRQAGYRFVIPGRTWVYHDPPDAILPFLKRMFSYGRGHALEARKAPDRQMDLVRLRTWYGKLFVLLSPLLFLPSLFLSVYLEPRPHLEVGLRPFKALSTYSTLYGYAWGWFRASRR